MEQNGLGEHEVPKTMEADVDQNQPLYFWQIHSLTGQEPLFDICSTFYDLVYDDDDNTWFKQVFEQTAPKDHHVVVQAAFWIDAMG